MNDGKAAPLVTVIIATYNKSAALQFAIESVLWQTMPDYEIWVIGDGCTDDSKEVVTSFDDPRVNWYNLPQNTGHQSEPNNEGLRRAKGKYIAYLHHDDIWLPTHLQTLVNRIEETGTDFVFSILEFVSYNGETNHVDIPQYPDAPRPPEASATMHRLDIVEDIGYWKSPEEAFAFPRVEYFRRAQFAEKRFELAPMLTVLKIDSVTSETYSELSVQPLNMQMIRDDPEFAHKRSAAMLASAYKLLQQPTSPKHFLLQLGYFVRRQAVKRKIDPVRLKFWRKRGRYEEEWRRDHRLDH